LVIVQGNISFIAGDAFSLTCSVTLARPDSDAEIREWNRCRQSRSGNAFERRT
jgi:hypothetical protein